MLWPAELSLKKVSEELTEDIFLRFTEHTKFQAMNGPVEVPQCFSSLLVSYTWRWYDLK